MKNPEGQWLPSRPYLELEPANDAFGLGASNLTEIKINGRETHLHMKLRNSLWLAAVKRTF
jgi:hypothetical protein